MIKITSDTFDPLFCEFIQNNVNLLWEYYKNFGVKVWLIPLNYPMIIKGEKENNGETKMSIHG